MVLSRKAEPSSRCIQERNSQETCKKGLGHLLPRKCRHLVQVALNPQSWARDQVWLRLHGERPEHNRASDLKSQNSPATAVISTEHITGGYEPSQELG